MTGKPSRVSSAAVTGEGPAPASAAAASACCSAVPAVANRSGSLPQCWKTEMREQPVGDHATPGRVAVHGREPVVVEVPVVGDLMVVEHHQRRRVGEHAPDGGQRRRGTARGWPVRRRRSPASARGRPRRAPRWRTPAAGRPATAPPTRPAGTGRRTRPASRHGPSRARMSGRSRWSGLAPRERRQSAERGRVVHADERGVDRAQAGCGQRGDVICVDLIAGQDQQVRPVGALELGQAETEGVTLVGVRPAAGRMEDRSPLCSPAGR